MKKIIVLIVTIAIMLISAFSVACKKNNIQSTESESQSQSSIKEELTPIPIVPSGDVDVSNVLNLFGSVINNDYVNVNLSLTDENSLGGEILTVNGYFKKTVRGYDAVIETSLASLSGEEWKNTAQALIYYVDGVAVTGNCVYDENGDAVWEYAKQTFGNVNQLISLLNKEIAENYSEEYTRVITLVDELKAQLQGVQIKDFFFPEISEFSTYANGLINTVLTNEQTSVYNFIMSEICGIDAQDEEAKKEFENDLKYFLSGNPSISDLVKKFINSFANSEVDLKTLLDDFQTKMGFTTAEAVEFINSKIEDEQDKLRNVVKNETLYDYLDSYLKLIKLERLIKDLVENQNIEGVESSDDAVDYLVNVLKQVNVKQTVNQLIGLVISANDKTDNAQGEEQTTVDTLTVVDYFEEFKTMNFAFNKLYLKASGKFDVSERPIEILISNEIDFSYDRETKDGMHRVTLNNSITFSALVRYVKPMGVKFEIPQDVFEKAEDLDVVE